MHNTYFYDNIIAYLYHEPILHHPMVLMVINLKLNSIIIYDIYIIYYSNN